MNPFHLVLDQPALLKAWPLLALPLVIHLLTRRTTRIIKFPSLQLLTTARASHSRLFRLRHWLLLLLRTLALTALLLAFLKPLWRTGVRPDKNTARTGSATAVVVILDTSASMAYQGDGGPVFAEARQSAGHLLRKLGPQDQANLILAGGQPRPVMSELTEHRFHLLNDLERATVTQERSDFDAALAEAVRQLDSVEASTRELHIVSDFQRSAWASVNFAAVPARIRLNLIPVGPDQRENTSLSDLTITPATPTPDEEVEISCRVTHHGTQAREIPLLLNVGDGFSTTRSLTLAPGASSVQTFRLRLGSTGWRDGEFRLPDDRLACDNHLYFALPVVEQIQVRVVTDEVRSRGSVRTILQRALNPYANPRRGALASQGVTSDQLGRPAPSSVQALLISEARAWESDTLEAVLTYLREGGSVLYFLATPHDAANVLQMEAKSGSDLRLAWRPRHLITPESPGAQPAALAGVNFEHALLHRFRDRTDLQEIRFFRRFAAERVREAGHLLMAFNQGDPALTVQSVGAGQLMLANFSPRPGASDLATRNLFVPLLHEWVRGLRPRQQSAHTFVVGAPCSTTVRGAGLASSATVQTPSGAHLPVALSMRQEEAAVLLGPVAEAGLYRIFNGAVAVGAVAVNVDQRESDPSRLAADKLRGRAGGSARPVHIAGAEETAEQFNRRSGRPVWPVFMLMLLGLLAMENLMMVVWKR
jgi:hypothetical protein